MHGSLERPVRRESSDICRTTKVPLADRVYQTDSVAETTEMARSG